MSIFTSDAPCISAVTLPLTVVCTSASDNCTPKASPAVPSGLAAASAPASEANSASERMLAVLPATMLAPSARVVFEVTLPYATASDSATPPLPLLASADVVVPIFAVAPASDVTTTAAPASIFAPVLRLIVADAMACA